MPYVALDDLVREFGETEIAQLTDRGNNNVIDEEVVNAKIEIGQSEVDGYLRGRFDVPFPDGQVPALVYQFTLDIVRFRLYTNGAPEDVRQAYDVAVARLREIAEGKVSLQAGDTKTQSASSSPQIKVSPSPVGDDALHGYTNQHSGGGSFAG